MGLWCDDSVGRYKDDDNKDSADHGNNGLHYSLRCVVYVLYYTRYISLPSLSIFVFRS